MALNNLFLFEGMEIEMVSFFIYVVCRQIIRVLCFGRAVLFCFKKIIFVFDYKGNVCM